MNDGGKRLKELLRKEGRTVEWVAERISVNPQTITRWKNNAPVGKLWEIHYLTGIPFIELAECFRPAPGTIEPDPSGGDEN